MKISMVDTKEQYEELKPELLKILDEVMSSSIFIIGENVKQIEKNVANLNKVNHGIGCSNGSDAIHIALEASGVGPGDEVITTSFTFFATAGSIVRAGAKPVFVDIDPITFNIDVKKIESAITNNTKAILPVHLYGQMADMESVYKIAKKHNLIIIEDAAQAIGAKFAGKSPGELSSAATFSFYPSKNLGAYGDGGMIITNDDEIADRMRVIRVHGAKPKYYHHVLGYNSRLDEMQAAILNIKFPKLKEWNELRRKKADYYSYLFDQYGLSQVALPKEINNSYHVYHQYTIRVDKRSELQEYLEAHGIETTIYYPLPLHLQPVFKYLDYKDGDLPETEKASKEVLSLPIYPELNEDTQRFIVSKIRDFFN
ncbi:DegT/DnrJ/EryC1/StrS family aminotransferase [Psychrobacillus vulpis]|uniref:DegT/DnrJ/EryC1/StrS family aminotransferase n=1 Tax=Psychrobacillus vulpis TaxID=2325572 RepID=A0A544TUB5_9BACI|nr:DegT/DnrJ/EryC1/StrS family aminotransferase [Psychrobacillus vulpis]TQR21029.1 DegT/DnrJ/EryC1/StrS family aminotransferase [Psychrobacillus vulpis]